MFDEEYDEEYDHDIVCVVYRYLGLKHSGVESSVQQMTMFVLIQDIYKRFNFITSKNWSPGLAIHNVIMALVGTTTDKNCKRDKHCMLQYKSESDHHHPPYKLSPSKASSRISCELLFF